MESAATFLWDRNVQIYFFRFQGPQFLFQSFIFLNKILKYVWLGYINCYGSQIEQYLKFFQLQTLLEIFQKNFETRHFVSSFRERDVYSQEDEAYVFNTRQRSFCQFDRQQTANKSNEKNLELSSVKEELSSLKEKLLFSA